MSYQTFRAANGGEIKAWVEGVHVDANTIEQAKNTASLPIVFSHVALMADCHYGIGATVGSVIATKGAVIPAAVGVDIGCGMCALQLSIGANDLPDSLRALRAQIERDVPVGFNDHKNVPRENLSAFNQLSVHLDRILEKHPALLMQKRNPLEAALSQMGTLGGGNHFIELCLDEKDQVWIMLHSGSRGIGNRIGNYFINVAREEMRVHEINLPDRDLAYLKEGTQSYDDYVEAVGWAQQYAKTNRDCMMRQVINALRHTKLLPDFTVVRSAINCHHNYVNQEYHFGEQVHVTRKGAVSARVGELGIIPGSMGARSYIVQGKGNADSFHSCSHGAGRVMSRGKAKKQISLEDHRKATEGIECRKDEGVLDESPAAYKDIDAVMAAQVDLVEPIYTLRQVICVKG